MNVYYHDGTEWRIAALCSGPHAAHVLVEELSDKYPQWRFVVADELPRG